MEFSAVSFIFHSISLFLYRLKIKWEKIFFLSNCTYLLFHFNKNSALTKLQKHYFNDSSVQENQRTWNYELQAIILIKKIQFKQKWYLQVKCGPSINFESFEWKKLKYLIDRFGHSEMKTNVFWYRLAMISAIKMIYCEKVRLCIWCQIKQLIITNFNWINQHAPKSNRKKLSWDRPYQPDIVRSDYHLLRSKSKLNKGKLIWSLF